LLPPVDPPLTPPVFPAAALPPADLPLLERLPLRLFLPPSWSLSLLKGVMIAAVVKGGHISSCFFERTARLFNAKQH
jgi:hypothetical protein